MYVFVPIKLVVKIFKPLSIGEEAQILSLNVAAILQFIMKSIVKIIISYTSSNFYRKCVCVCSNANPLHYYMFRVPRKVDRWH